MSVVVQRRRDTAANWTAINPIIPLGQFCYETDSIPIKFKIGDGIHNWQNLPYGGISGPPGNVVLPATLGMELVWDAAHPDFYTEVIYTAGLVSRINIWTDSGMTVKLFRKDFVYTGGLPTSIVTTREADGATLTKTITYSAGNVANVTHTHTP